MNTTYSQGTRAHSGRRYRDLTENYDARIGETLRQLRYAIPRAKESVTEDIVSANRDKIIIGLANFLGMVFGIASGARGDINAGNWNQSERIQVLAQALYGYGYTGQYWMNLEPKSLNCDQEDLDKAMDRYSYLGNLAHTFRFLDGYDVRVSGDPRKYLADPAMTPVVMEYYAVELNHAMQESLYCIVSWSLELQHAVKRLILVNLSRSRKGGPTRRR